MSHPLLGYAAVGAAALSPPVIMAFAPHFKRTSRERVKRFLLTFVLWALFAPIVWLVVYFAATPESIKAALEIFDWWLFTTFGLGCLILCLITIIVAYKRDDPLRSAEEHAANTRGLMEFSGFVLNNAQSLWVIAAFVVAADGDLLTVIAYGVTSVLFVFIAWVIAP